MSKCERRSECTVRGVKEALGEGKRSCERACANVQLCKWSIQSFYCRPLCTIHKGDVLHVGINHTCAYYACITSTAFTLAPCSHQMRMHHITILHSCSFASAVNGCIQPSLHSPFLFFNWHICPTRTMANVPTKTPDKVHPRQGLKNVPGQGTDKCSQAGNLQASQAGIANVPGKGTCKIDHFSGVMTSCSMQQHPSLPSQDQTLREHSGGMVRRAAKQALPRAAKYVLRCNTQLVY